MLWFTMLAVWCASGCAHGARAVPPASDKPFYTEESHSQHFTEFKVTYNKQYATPEEERHRFAVFKINVLNSKTKLAVYGINKFTDLTEEEMFPPNTRLTQVRALSFTLKDDLPDVEKPFDFDWRKKNVVTKVKDQGRCGSGWAFAIMGVIEAQYAMKYKSLVDFSAQQLIDCDKNSDGCSGGNPLLTCGYLEREGAMTEKDYPYVDKNSTVINKHECAYNPQKVSVRVTECRNHADTFSQENEVVKALFLKGPIAVVVSATGLQHYRSGIIDDCKTNTVNHGALITGYGVANDPKNYTPYWNVKNSWGEQWGEKGYFRIFRKWPCLGIPNMYAISVDIEI